MLHPTHDRITPCCKPISVLVGRVDELFGILTQELLGLALACKVVGEALCNHTDTRR